MKKKNLVIKILVVMMIFSGVAIANNTSLQNQNNNQVVIEENSTLSADMADYVAKVRKAIKSNWYPPVKSFEKQATLVVTIDKEGQLTNCYILESSSDKAFDDSLIEAAKKSKFAPAPVTKPAKSASFALTFEMHRRHITK